MKKKFASLFLVLALVLTMIPASAFASTEITYTNTSAGNVVEGFPNNYGVTISTDKAEYTLDENIYLKVEGAANATAGGWIGIYKDAASNNSTTTECWVYTDTTNDSVKDVTDFVIYGPDATCYDGVDGKINTALTPGTYYVIHMASDDRWAMVPITITGETGGETPEAPTELISTDKTSYKYGDAIKVTTNYEAGSTDWVGIYQKGQEPGSEMPSIAWYYVKGNETEFNITDFANTHDGAVPEKQQSALWNGKLKAGEYTVKLCKNDSYTVAEEHDIVIEKETYGEPVVTPAGCEKAGSSVQWYTDGTSVSTPIDALEHVWSDWAFDAETRTHSRTCSASEHEAQTGNCSGVAVGEPVIDENGVTTTYKCSVCEGIYTETVESGYEFVETVTVPATCEEDGETYDLYVNAAGDTMKLNVTPIAKLGHAYGDWTPVGDGTHQQVCANDASHVKTGDCVTEESYDGADIVTTCTECGDETRETVITLEKEIYGVGEEIKVTTKYKGTDKDWIGVFYEPEEGFGGYPWHEAKGWKYISSNPETFVVNLEETYATNGGYGSDAFTAGFFNEDGTIIAGNWVVAIARNDASAANENFVYAKFKVCEHAYDRFNVIKDATCDEPGLQEVTCHRCGDTYEEEIPAGNHKWNDGVVTTAPTCKDAGVMTYTCTVDGCGETKTEAIDKLNEHDWNAGDVTKAPTCKAAGEKTFVCGVCKATKTEAVAVDPNAHKEVTVPGKAASCTATGLTDGKKCELCEKVTVAQTEIAKVAHDSKVTIPGKDATCTAKGLTEGKKCSVCGTVTVPQKDTDMIAHAWDGGKVTKEPTCTTTGVNTTTCTGCGATKASVIAAKGHTIVDVAGKDATCTESGLTAGKKCSVCGTETVAQTVIEKLPHAAATTETTKATLTKAGKIVEKCACGEVVSEKAIARIKTVKLAKPTAVYTGKAQKIKVTVKDSANKTIAATNYTVTYKNNTKVGKATVTVKFKGNYSGTKTLTFKINPKAPVIKKPVAAKKAVTVKWGKVAKEATGYEVMVATNKKFTQGKKTATVKKASIVSKKMTKLKAKKTYYVKVRTYKTVKGVKYYSAWSAVKTVKTK